MRAFWPHRRAMVTGGGGYLDQAIVKRLEASGADSIFVPCSRDYDHRTKDGIDQAVVDGRPQLVIHLPAVVGGIGANGENPGRFFYPKSRPNYRVGGTGVSSTRRRLIETLMLGRRLRRRD